MSRRNNMDRVGGPNSNNAEAPPQTTTEQKKEGFNPLNFVAPTDFVELPSKGRYYPSGHPLHNQEVIEIRFMTAKDEDILSSRALLKKGIAIERFLQNIIVNKSIRVEDLLVGDRNAILIASRISGYGAEYETQINCPACSHRSTFTFNLNNKTYFDILEVSEKLKVKKVDDGLFETEMPFSKFKIQFKLLNGKDEVYLAQVSSKKQKNKALESALTEQYKLMIKSIEGHTDFSVISQYVSNMPTLDSRHLRACYKSVAPDVKVIENFECPSCGHEQEMEVPFGADFFWPDR